MCKPWREQSVQRPYRWSSRSQMLLYHHVRERHVTGKTGLLRNLKVVRSDENSQDRENGLTSSRCEGSRSMY